MTYLDENTASIGWSPAASDRILLAGDENSLPTIRTILATLPAKSRGQVFIEVESTGDIEELVAPGRFAVCWLARDRAQSLRRSVDAWLSEMLPVSAFDDHSVYAWIAHEGAARTLTSN
ncbi:MAG: siderophore-interacting protein [Microbacteriaceae bacterium]|jgi:NADPH-dependent ferric siderophore reductase|nr:siderophore-interacting protein [Microbacteriaceae bacterium]